MNKSTWPFRVVGVAGVVALLVVVLVHPAGALSSLYQTTPEPTPRWTPTPAPFLDLYPTQGISGDRTEVSATGGFWPAGETVELYWHGEPHLLGEATVAGNGDFEIVFTTPTGPVLAAVGLHQVVAVAEGGMQAEAFFEMLAPTPTNTPRPSNTPTPTGSPTPITPTPTQSSTPTPTPSPTLRAVTPMVTVTPIQPTAKPTKAVTKAPTATRTNTPVPGTPTSTLTPSITPTPTHTPGPGTPSVTPEVTPTPVEDLSETGGGWGTVFLWGFVLAGLVVVFRLLRVRGLREQA